MNNKERCLQLHVNSVANNPANIMSGEPYYLGFDFFIKKDDINEMIKFVSLVLNELDVPLINMTILSIYLKTSFKTYILSLIIPILCSIFTSIMGIILNCFFINYEYKNEIQIIKQSAPAFISIFIGFVSFLLPFNIDIDLSKHLNELIIGLLVADIIIYIFMKHVSSKQFKDA